MDMVCRSKSYCGEKKHMPKKTYVKKNIFRKKHIPKKTYSEKNICPKKITRKHTENKNKHTEKTNI
jgi:hypothetical protein